MSKTNQTDYEKILELCTSEIREAMEEHDMGFDAALEGFLEGLRDDLVTADFSDEEGNGVYDDEDN
jgi:hypothetical protein